MHAVKMHARIDESTDAPVVPSRAGAGGLPPREAALEGSWQARPEWSGAG